MVFCLICYLRMRATPEWLRGVYTTRHYANPRLPYSPYLCQGSYISPSICLSSFSIFMWKLLIGSSRKFTRDVSATRENWLNHESHPHLHPGVFRHFPQFGPHLWKNPMNIREDFNTEVSFVQGSYPDPDSRYGLQIWTLDMDAGSRLDSPWWRSVFSEFSFKLHS